MRECVCEGARVCQCMRLWEEYLRLGEGKEETLGFYIIYYFFLLFFCRYERRYVRLILRYDIHGFIL